MEINPQPVSLFRMTVGCLLAFFLSSFSFAQTFQREEESPSRQLVVKDTDAVVWYLANSLAYRNAFVFSPRSLTWRAYNSHGRVIRSGHASGGAGYCRDIKRSCRTPVGSFRIISKRGANCRSSRYPLGRGGAPMPYCMFFSKYYAIHGSPNVPRYNASHGCIRVRPNAARWLYHNFIRHGTRVVVLPY